MKSKILLISIAVLILSFSGCIKKDDLQIQDIAVPDSSLTLKSVTLSGKYIVVLNDDANLKKSDFQSRNAGVKAKAYGLLKKYTISGDPEEVYETALQGFSIKMTPGQAKKLATDSDIKFVEPDQMVTLSPIVIKKKPGGDDGGSVSQTTPWGITRVGGGISGIGKKVWIIDTGVDLTHPDLTVDASLGKSFVPRVTSPNDDNGHGSHVAGTIAAKNNTIGVIGVAAGATVVPVKVLDRKGSGAYSIVISGVNYVATVAASGDVANMSLGGPVSDALDLAIINAAAKGIKFALAAGNEASDANLNSPARINGTTIYTVSAMDNSDVFAYFSNYGNPPIDFAAPGVSIYSTYKAGGYATLSGTSMAAPHVAGLLLLSIVQNDGNVLNDPDGNADPIAHH
ncbi:MAG: S8 family serine peptidase [Prolixibacteraceae bacterium]|jgi:subtilisin family serine protease